MIIPSKTSTEGRGRTRSMRRATSSRTCFRRWVACPEAEVRRAAILLTRMLATDLDDHGSRDLVESASPGREDSDGRSWTVRNEGVSGSNLEGDSKSEAPTGFRWGPSACRTALAASHKGLWSSGMRFCVFFGGVLGTYIRNASRWTG